VDIGIDIDKRLAKLGSAVRAVRRATPWTKSFPEELRREAGRLVRMGVDVRRIAQSCELTEKTIEKWEICYPEQNRIPVARKLQVVHERQPQGFAEISQKEKRCEIDLGCAVTLRIPMEELTRDLLCALREVFQRC